MKNSNYAKMMALMLGFVTKFLDSFIQFTYFMIKVANIKNVHKKGI